METRREGNLKTEIGSPMPLGVTFQSGGINFAISLPGVKECNLKLYPIGLGEPAFILCLTETNKTGSVFAVMIQTKQLTKDNNPRLSSDFDLSHFMYTYEVQGNEFPDPYGKVLYGRGVFGEPQFQEGTQLKSGISYGDFNWQMDKKLKIPYSKLILYKLNIRSFTKHVSSKVKHGGTFAGLTEKIPYLKELGINAIQCMPMYEFNEIISNNSFGNHLSWKKEYKANLYINDSSKKEYKVNLWGYCNENYYFAPKVSYGINAETVVNEVKTMIQSLHHNGIEFIMEMHFPNGTNQNLIQDCLRYWVQEYHVDGFKLSGEAVPYQLLASDPLLSDTKLLAASWDTDGIYGREFVPEETNLAEYNDVFSTSAKRLLRGDESSVKAFAERLKFHPLKSGVINYITNQDGFTLMDLYSYDRKHNERNGENNADGIEINYSWNCGVEGKTNKKKIVELRKKQIRNAFVLLFCSQGTPLILSGDEFGNSQQGNNNPYCQDNEITWLNWEDLEENREIFQYVKAWIQFRMGHPILHMDQPLKSMDYIACGFPDISFHGTKAWYPDYSFYSRQLGVMLSGRYAKINRTENDVNLYLAINMHWENHTFDLPMLPKAMKWHIIADTRDKIIREEGNLTPIENQTKYEVIARSCTLFIGK